MGYIRRLTVCIAKFNTLETLLDHSTLASDRGTAHDPSLVIEITQNYENSPSLGAKCVFHRNLNVVERNECGTSCRRVTSLDLTSFNTFTALNENDSDAILGLASNSEAN